jgi:hemerythrin
MIDFDVVPKVVIDFINEDHKHFTDLTNQLEALLADAGSEPQVITAQLAQLLEHCREHFGREEQQMQLFVFPPYPVHKGEHERVLAEMESVVSQWLQSQDRAALMQYVEALPHWFIGHAATMDTVTASYIVRMGGPAVV